MTPEEKGKDYGLEIKKFQASYCGEDRDGPPPTEQTTFRFSMTLAAGHLLTELARIADIMERFEERDLADRERRKMERALRRPR